LACEAQALGIGGGAGEVELQGNQVRSLGLGGSFDEQGTDGEVVVFVELGYFVFRVADHMEAVGAAGSGKGVADRLCRVAGQIGDGKGLQQCAAVIRIAVIEVDVESAGGSDAPVLNHHFDRGRVAVHGVFRGDGDVGGGYLDIHHVAHDAKLLAVVGFIPLDDGIGPVDGGIQGVDAGWHLPGHGDGAAFTGIEAHA